MTAAPDKSLERYEIIDRIAVGGMAEVFRAKVEAATEPYHRDDLTIAAHGGGFAAAGHFEED